MKRRSNKTQPKTRLSMVRSLSALFALLVVPLAVSAASKSAHPAHTSATPAVVPADVPSGFFPGIINYFAGDGPSLGGAYADGSLPTQVPLPQPVSAVVDSKGNAYISVVNNTLYMVYAGGTVPAALANVTRNATPPVTPVAGRIYQIAGNGSGCGECAGMPLNQVVLGSVYGMAIDAQDNLYYADQTYYVVRKVSAATGAVNTVAGTWNTAPGGATGDGGPATSGFIGPTDIKLDQWGNLYINDYFDDLVRVVYSGTQAPPILAAENVTVGPSQQNYIYTVAGNLTYCTTPGACGDDGSATAAGLGYQFSIAVDSAGNLFIADATADTTQPYPYVRAVYAGGAVPPLLNLYLNPSGGSTVTPTAGYIYPVTGYSLTTPFAECGAAPCGDGGLAGSVQFGGTGASLSAQLHLESDSLGNLYVADEYTHAVRKIDNYGYASTVAGIDDPNQTVPAAPVPSGGTAVGTALDDPLWASFDSQNNLYIVDIGYDLIWEALDLLPQSITFPALSNVNYGTAPITLAATASSGLPVQYSVASTPSGIATVNGSALVISGAGTVQVTASQPGNSTYLAAPPVTGSFTVAPAPLTVTANAATKVFGAPNPAFTATITGFVNGDTALTPGAVSGAPAFTTTAGTTSPQGTYPIVPSLGTLASSNYTFPPANFIPGILTISGNVPQTINFPPFSPGTIQYGHGPINLSATATSGGPVAFVLVSGPGSLAGPNGSVLSITGAGTILVQAIQNGYNQYQAATPVSQSLMVSPAVLTVTGPSVTTTFGTAINPATFPAASITGFVGADTQSTVLTGSPLYAIPSGTLNAGTYPITVTLGSLTLLPAAAQNYVFATPVNGALIITPGSQVINFNPIPAGQTYGQFVTLTASATSGLPVIFTVTGPTVFYNNINSILELNGVGTFAVTATQSGNGNYLAATPVTQTVPVAPALLQVMANNFIREQGAANPTFTYVVGCTNPVPGCWVLNDTDIPSVITGIPNVTTSATSSSSPGTYPIVISQGTLAAPNYSFVFVNGTLTVTPPGTYAITANPASLTIPRGQSGQSTLTITPANHYQGSVTLSCGQLPANVSCIISPATYLFPGSQNPDGSENPAQGTITINTAAGTIVGAIPAQNPNLSRAGLIFPGAAFGFLILFARRRAAKWLSLGRLVAVLIIGLSALSLISCDGKSTFSTAAPGTVTVSINGTGTTPSGGGSVTASAPLTVVIQ